jgi:biotin carboxyl carrier protein
MQRNYRNNEETFAVSARIQGDQLLLDTTDGTRALQWVALSPGEYVLQHEGKQTRCVVAQDGDDRWVWVGGVVHHLKLETGGSAHGHAASADNLLSPMPGLVLKVFVAAGDRVERNQVLVVLEAMKMQYEITAPRDGTVSEVDVQEGQQVDGAVPLVVLEEEGDA